MLKLVLKCALQVNLQNDVLKVDEVINFVVLTQIDSYCILKLFFENTSKDDRISLPRLLLLSPLRSLTRWQGEIR